MRHSPLRLVLGLLGLLIVVGGLGLARFQLMTGGADRASAASPSAASQPPTPVATDQERGDPPAVLHEIPERGRLSVDLASESSTGPFLLSLRLTEPEKHEAPRPVRIICTDGRRLDTLAHPMRAPAPALRVEVERAFLEVGMYLIEVDTAESHPLNLRRYVLEIR